LATATTPLPEFSVPVDASNLLYNLSEAKSIQIEDQFRPLFWVVLWFISTGNQGAVGRLSQNDYKKILNALQNSSRKKGSVFDLSELLNDSNLNTLGIECEAPLF
jgi:hypothetical protein